jgi:tRNA (cytidine/uridine-2'-O-)-methyltransferase
VGRLCAFTGTRLHLVRPLGFEIDDAKLRRSGMDYWFSLDLHLHDDWAALQASPARPVGRLWLLTTHATRTIWDASFADGDALVFGNEGHGAPDWLHAEIGEARRITIPRYSDKPLRSLNLSTAAGIALYEALRQLRG